MTVRLYLRLALVGIVIGSFITSFILSYGIRTRGEFADGWMISRIVGGTILSIIIIRRFWMPIAISGSIYVEEADLCVECKHHQKEHELGKGKCNNAGLWIIAKPCPCEKFHSYPDPFSDDTSQFEHPWGI